jgi:hypothetical protein
MSHRSFLRIESSSNQHKQQQLLQQPTNQTTNNLSHLTTKPTNPTPNPSNMHATLIFTSTLALVASAFGASINRPRGVRLAEGATPSGAAAPDYIPAQNPDFYTVSGSSVLGGAWSQQSDPETGNAWHSFVEGDVVRTLNGGDATCIARDGWGNQVRRLGSPEAGVFSITFEEQDGAQIRSISCVKNEH